MTKALGVLAAVAIGGGALAALARSQPSGSVVVPGSKPPPPPKPPPPVPQPPPPSQGGVTNLSTFGWAWMPIGQVPTGLIRCAAVVTGMNPGDLPRFVEVMGDYTDLRLYSPYTADPDDWPAGPEGLLLSQNPYYAQQLQGWQVVHWEGHYSGVTSPYKIRPSPAQGGFVMVYACWVKSSHGVA